jgi:two-component system, cell cycle sensor histidine kinase and response regulator CckA
VTIIQKTLILASLVGISVLDALTPLGAPTWLLYLFPVLYVSLKAGRTEVVIHMFLVSALILTDFFLSPQGLQPLFAGMNRALWLAALWGLSFFNLWRNEMEKNLSAANEKIRQSEEKLRNVFDNSYDAIFIHDPDGKIIDVNRRMLEMYDVDYRQALSLSIIDFSSPDNPIGLASEIMRKAAAGENQFFEWKARRPKTDSVFDVEVYLAKMKLKERTAILAIVRDITERKQLEDELRLTRFSIEHASICAYLVGSDARFLYVNEQACRTLGYTRQELLSMAVYDLDPDFPLSVWNDHWAHLKKEGSLHFETTHRRKDGTLVPMDLTLNLLAFGDRDYNVAFGLDVSERKKAEQEIAIISRRNELVLKAAGEGILGLDAQGNVTFINRAAAAMLGYEEQELIGRQGRVMCHCSRPDATAYPADKCPMIKAFRDEPIHSGEELFCRKDSTSFPVAYTSMPFQENGLSGTVVTFRDISEQKRAEEALKQAYAGLETKVRERTRALAEANSELRLEISERQSAEELIRKSKELSDGLNKLAALIHSTLDLDEIMQRVLEEAASIMKVDAALIGGFDGDTFQVRYSCNMPEAFTSRKLTTHELRAFHQVTLVRDTLAFDDAFNDERLNIEFVQEVGIRSVLVAPFLKTNQVAGVLAFYGFSRQILFDEGHIDFARKLAASISLALENAHLYHALTESEKLASSRFAQLKTIYDTAPIGLCFLDTTYRYLSINKRLAEINNIPVEETLGRKVHEVLPAIGWHVESFCKHAAETGRPVENLEITGKSLSTNQDMTVSTSYYPVRDQTGGVLGFNIVVQDITERKRMEEALRASEKRFRDLIEATSDWVWEIDNNGIYTYASPQVKKILGYEPEEVLGKTFFDLMPSEEAARIAAIVGEIAASRKPFPLLENICLHKNGTRVVLESSGIPFFDTSGSFKGYRGIDRDITERKKIEEELQKAQKLESIGLLAGGIAHDFNNILTAIQGNIELAKIFLPPGDKAAERLAIAEQASLRARGLSQQLLTFAKGGAPIMKTTDVPHLVRETVELALRGSNVKGEYFFSEDLRPVEADESQLNQAVSNLALNAIEAMPEGGVITAAAVNISLAGDNTPGLPAGRYVRIDIRDQGVGIPEEIKDRIFDPYFTTKDHGSGLGLATSFSIVKRHNGAITVDSEPGRGSTFSIFLPASQKGMAAHQPEESGQVESGTGRILVMDDEAAVSDVAVEMLQHLGYRAEAVRDGAEAITAYRQAMEEGRPFAAVITDLTVPAGMGGKETVRRLLEMDPQAKVIVSSGYANDPIMSDYAGYGFKGVIPKPYKLDELGKTMREIVGQKEALGV